MVLDSLIYPMLFMGPPDILSWVWSVVIIVTTLLSIHLWIWKFLLSLIQWRVMYIISEMFFISFGGHSIFPLEFQQLQQWVTLPQSTSKGGYNVIHNQHIIIFILAGCWLNDNIFTLNIILSLLIIISNYFSCNCFLAKTVPAKNINHKVYPSFKWICSIHFKI